jgi:spermidine synthase
MVNSPYLLIPLGILSVFLYLLSYMLSGTGIISKTWHRRIWNILLLTTFLATAILGLLLAVQINYKLEWPVVKALLKWHVNFGIALSFVALFHLLWHLNYYLKILKPVHPARLPQEEKATVNEESRSGTLKLILLSGFAATIIQVLLIREMTTVFQGNEMMMGWAMGIWMFLTGSGSFLGRNLVKPVRKLNVIILLLGILPLVSVITVNLIKNILFPPGMLINPVLLILIVSLLFSPVCLLSGLLFPLLVRISGKEEINFIRVYSLEALGSLAGGVVVSLILINWLNVLQSLALVLFVINLVLFVRERNILIGSGLVMTLILVIAFFILPVNLWLKSSLFINQAIRESTETFYGNLTVTENSDQFSYFDNGSLIFTSDNLISSEENVHYAMLQRDNIEKVLLVGGGVSGMLREILKYSKVRELDYIEINPQLIRISSKYVKIPDDKRINIITADPKRWLVKCTNQYDAVILAIPDPSSFLINRFYTDEFLKILKKHLNPGAVVILSHSSSGNYVSPGMALIEGSIYYTLTKNFPYVEVIPGDRDYFVSSDSLVTSQVALLPTLRGIENSYVNQYYIDNLSISQRSGYVKNRIGTPHILNTDLRPIPVFFHSLHYLKGFSNSTFYILLIILIFLLIPVFFMSPVSTGVFTAGFTASSVEILLIFSFQTWYGYVYSALGMIIAVFMGGLATGSVLCNRIKAGNLYFKTGQVLLMIYSLLFPAFIYFQKGLIAGTTGLFLFFLATFIIAVIVGFQFAMGTRLMNYKINGSSAMAYAADLWGSSLGIIAVTALLLPFFGLNNSCYIIGGLNFLAAAYFHFKNP